MDDECDNVGKKRADGKCRVPRLMMAYSKPKIVGSLSLDTELPETNGIWSFLV